VQKFLQRSILVLKTTGQVESTDHIWKKHIRSQTSGSKRFEKAATIWIAE